MATNTVLHLLMVGISFSLASGERFSFAIDGSPCIMMNVDATFDLTKTGPDPKVAPSFNLTQARVIDDQSICDETNTSTHILTVQLFPSSETLQFKFKATGSTVQMSAIATLDLKKHFTDDNETATIEFETSNNLPVGPLDKSFQCSSATLNFDEDKPYDVVMSMSNLQVQAFNVKGDFGPVNICPKDAVSTTPEPTTNASSASSASTNPSTQSTPTSKGSTTPTTGPTSGSTSPKTSPSKSTTQTTKTTPGTPVSTKPSSTGSTSNSPTPTASSPQTSKSTPTSVVTTPETNSTTPESNSTTPEPTSPTPEPTSPTPEPTTEPVPFAPKFGLKDGDGSYCVVLQGNIKFVISYNQTNNTDLVDAEVQIPSNATISGDCTYQGNNDSQQIVLAFFEGWKWSLVIGSDTPVPPVRRRLLADVNSYSWQKIDLVYVLDEHFEDPVNAGASVTVTAEPTFDEYKGDAEGFKCTSEQTTALEGQGQVRMDTTNLQYLAFGSGNTTDLPQDGGESVCAADKDDDDDDDDDDVGVIVGATIGGVAALVILILIVLYVRNRRRKDYVVM